MVSRDPYTSYSIAKDLRPCAPPNRHGCFLVILGPILLVIVLLAAFGVYYDWLQRLINAFKMSPQQQPQQQQQQQPQQLQPLNSSNESEVLPVYTKYGTEGATPPPYTPT